MDVVAFFQYITKSGIFLPHITRLQKLIFIDYIKQFLVANAFYRTAAIFQYECKFLGFDTADDLTPRTSNSMEFKTPILNSNEIDASISEIPPTENINAKHAKRIKKLKNTTIENTISDAEKTKSEDYLKIEEKIYRTFSLPNISNTREMPRIIRESHSASSSANQNKLIKKISRTSRKEFNNQFEANDTNENKFDEQNKAFHITLTENSLINSSNFFNSNRILKTVLPKEKQKFNLPTDTSNHMQHINFSKTRSVEENSKNAFESKNVIDLIRNETDEITKTESPSRDIALKYDFLLKKYLKLQADFITLKKMNIGNKKKFESNDMANESDNELKDYSNNINIAESMKYTTEKTNKTLANVNPSHSFTTLSVSNFINSDIYFDLNFNKVIKDLQNGPTYLKLKLLQALRWRLTHSSDLTQIKIIKSYVSNDLFCLMESESTTIAANNNFLLSSLFFPENLSTPHPLQQRIARLVNTVASLKYGRDYLARSYFVLENILLKIILQRSQISFNFDKVTEQMVVATLQKLSLRNSQRIYMISQGVVEYLLMDLTDHLSTMSMYQMEYETALLMNLCLHKEAQNRCALMIPTLINLLKLLLEPKWTQCLLYANGTMYSLFVNIQILNAVRKTEIPNIIKSRIEDVNGELKEQLICLHKILTNPKFANSQKHTEPKDESTNEIDLLEAELDRGDNMFDNGSNDPFTGECFLYHEYREIKEKPKFYLKPDHQTLYCNRPLQYSYNCTINIPVKCTFMLKEDKTVDFVFSPSIMHTADNIPNKSKSSGSPVTLENIATSSTCSDKIVQTVNNKYNTRDETTSTTDILPNTIVSNEKMNVVNDTTIITNSITDSTKEFQFKSEHQSTDEISNCNKQSILIDDGLKGTDAEGLETGANKMKSPNEICDCGNPNCLCEKDSEKSTKIHSSEDQMFQNIEKSMNINTSPPNTIRQNIKGNANKFKRKLNNNKVSNQNSCRQRRLQREKKIENIMIEDNTQISYAEYTGQYYKKPTKNEIFQRKNGTLPYSTYNNLFPRSFTYSAITCSSCKKPVTRDVSLYPSYKPKCLNNCHSSFQNNRKINMVDKINADKSINKFEDVDPTNASIFSKNFCFNEFSKLKNIDNLKSSESFFNNTANGNNKLPDSIDKPYTFFSQLSSPDCVYEKCKRKINSNSNNCVTILNSTNDYLNEGDTSIDSVIQPKTCNNPVIDSNGDVHDPFITRCKLTRTPTEEN